MNLLPCDTEEERKQLILVEETKIKYGYDLLCLTRHCSKRVVFKCPVCQEAHENTYKCLMDKKGICHSQCSSVLRSLASKKVRAQEDPSIQEKRSEALRKKIKKDKREIINKRKQTNLEKYGAEAFQSTSEWRTKRSQQTKQKYQEHKEEILAKRRKTNLEKYGASNYLISEEGKEKIIKSNQEKYQANYPFQSEIARTLAHEVMCKKYNVNNPREIVGVTEKIKESCLQKYGVKNPQQNLEVRQKTKETNLQKYGSECFLQSEEGKKIISIILSSGERLIDVCEKHKVPPTWARIIYNKYGEEAFLRYCENHQEPTSFLEEQFISLVKDKIVLEHYNKVPPEISKRRKPDFRIEHNNRLLFVNVDGLYWHIEKNIRPREDASAQNYHLDLQQEFEKHGLTIFQFREDEVYNSPEIVKSIVLNYLGIHEKKYHARKLIVKKVAYDDMIKFFNENHLMGTTPSTGYGLYDNEELISCLSVRWKSKENKELEIARFASKLNCAVRGGFSKLLKHIEKEYNPSSIISFCDMRYSTGASYEKNGFINEKTTLGFEWTDFKDTFNRLRCKANMDERKLTQEQQAQELGWARIFDAGQRKYRKTLK